MSSSEKITTVNEIGGSEIDASAAESSDEACRREVWSRPANGVAAAAAAAETGIVISGDDLWPSLSEGVNTRVKPSYRPVPESSLSLTSHASSSKSNAGYRSTRTNLTHNGNRSGSNRQPKNNATRSAGNGERSQHQHHRSSTQPDNSSNNGLHNGNSNPEAGQINGPRPQFDSGGNHPQHRDSTRRGNGGPPRGDVSHGRRRNVDRDANTHTPSFINRSGPLQAPVFPGPFPIPIPRPALPVTPYPPPTAPHFPPMPYMVPGMHHFAGRPVFYGPPVGPIVMKPHPLFVPLGPPVINAELCKQIDYYFSDENLVRDVHLRINMDEQGWVMVTIIAKFKKVEDIMAKVKQFLDEKKIDPLWFILNAMLNSYNVEVKGNKLRKRIDWKKYVLRNSGESSFTAAESQANEKLSAPLENKVIEEDPVISTLILVATDDQAGHQPC